MELLFTRSSKIGSRLIRLVTGEPVSHVAVLFSSGLVAHATPTGVEFTSDQQFLSSHEVVHSLPFEIDEELALTRLIQVKGQSYDFGAYFWIGLKYFFHTTGNHWTSSKKLICTELVVLLLGMDDSEILTAGQLYTRLTSITKS